MSRFSPEMEKKYEEVCAEIKKKQEDLLTSPKLPGKIDLLRKRWWELFQVERELRDFDRSKTGIHLTIRAVGDARNAVLDAVREFFCEEMGGGKR